MRKLPLTGTQGMLSRHKILGICTDTITKKGKIILRKGKRQAGAIGWYRIINPLKKLGADIQIGMTLRSSAGRRLVVISTRYRRTLTDPHPASFSIPKWD